MTTPAFALVTGTVRLELHWAGEHTDIDALLEVFNSNPQWIAATNDFAGQTTYDRSDVEMFLWQGTMREGSRCLEIRERGNDKPIGVLAWIAPHPRDHCPWIGSIVLRADRQRGGLGREVLQELEQRLALEGWERVRASPLRAQLGARSFLESLGYSDIEERLDQDKRRCMVMEKRLIGDQHCGRPARLTSACSRRRRVRPEPPRLKPHVRRTDKAVIGKDARHRAGVRPTSP